MTSDADSACRRTNGPELPFDFIATKVHLEPKADA